MDRMIGTLLRIGVLLSAATTLLGGIWHFFQHGGAVLDYHVFRGEPGEMGSLWGVIGAIARGRSEALIQLGLLMLIATPIARVALSVVAFMAEHDRTYVVITLIVLGVLVASVSGLHF